MTEAIDYGRLSQWRDTAGISEATTRDMAARLELRARAEDETTARDAYVQLLGVAPGDHVLDVGCGSGVVTRVLAQRVAPNGRVVGVDASPALLTVAREYAEEAGLSRLIEFREGDCRVLPCPDAAFDVTVAVTVLTHVPDVRRALAEMVRVTRGGGRVGVFDFDGDMFVIAHPDRELTRRIVVGARRPRGSQRLARPPAPRSARRSGSCRHTGTGVHAVRTRVGQFLRGCRRAGGRRGSADGRHHERRASALARSTSH